MSNQATRLRLNKLAASVSNTKPDSAANICPPALIPNGKNCLSNAVRAGKLGVTAESRLTTPTNAVKSDTAHKPIRVR